MFLDAILWSSDASPVFSHIQWNEPRCLLILYLAPFTLQKNMWFLPKLLLEVSTIDSQPAIYISQPLCLKTYINILVTICPIPFMRLIMPTYTEYKHAEYHYKHIPLEFPYWYPSMLRTENLHGFAGPERLLARRPVRVQCQIAYSINNLCFY